MLPEVGCDALNLLENLMIFNPNNRLTAAQALEHPYVATWDWIYYKWKNIFNYWENHIINRIYTVQNLFFLLQIMCVCVCMSGIIEYLYSDGCFLVVYTDSTARATSQRWAPTWCRCWETMSSCPSTSTEIMFTQWWRKTLKQRAKLR